MGGNGSTRIESCEIQRVKYRIGESLRVLYRVSANGAAELIAAKTFSPQSAQFFDANTQTAFWMFPNDRKIKHLTLLRNRPEVLSKVLGDEWCSSEAIAYVPEKCATVRSQNRDGETIAYAKVYAPAEGQGVAESYRQLASACPHVVRPLEYSELHHLLLLEAVPGKRIADLKNDELADGFAGLAQALAALHSAPLPSHPKVFQRHDLDRLRNGMRIVGIARPDIAAVAEQLERELRSTTPPAEPLVCLHGDVHPKNGIASGGLVTLIDLDQSGAGPAAADLGSLLALLYYNWRTGLITRAVQRKLVDAFLKAYARRRPLPTQESLSWHTAAALLSERVVRSVNRVKVEGLRHLPRLIADAREILETGGVKS
jgi:aminoglycoside phosphotransferase